MLIRTVTIHVHYHEENQKRESRYNLVNKKFICHGKNDTHTTQQKNLGIMTGKIIHESHHVVIFVKFVHYVTRFEMLESYIVQQVNAVVRSTPRQGNVYLPLGKAFTSLDRHSIQRHRLTLVNGYTPREL